MNRARGELVVALLTISVDIGVMSVTEATVWPDRCKQVKVRKVACLLGMNNWPRLYLTGSSTLGGFSFVGPDVAVRPVQ